MAESKISMVSERENYFFEQFKKWGKPIHPVFRMCIKRVGENAGPTLSSDFISHLTSRSSRVHLVVTTVSLILFHTHASLRVFKLKFKMPAEYSIFSKRKASSAGQPSVHSYILIVSGICCLLPKCRKRLLNRVSYVVRSSAGLLMSSVTWKRTTLTLRSFYHFV